MPIGEVLIQQGHLTREQLDTALEAQKTMHGKRIGEILVELGLVSKEDVDGAMK